MMKNGILLQSFNPSFSHKEEELNITFKAIEKSLEKLKKVIENKEYKNHENKHIIKPVFRRYN